MENGQVKCPKCKSTQVSANKKGFSGTKAVAGAVLTGGVGLLAGTIGSNNIIITCLSCGNTFKPGEKPMPQATLIPATIWDHDTETRIPNPEYIKQKKGFKMAFYFFLAMTLLCYFGLHITFLAIILLVGTLFMALLSFVD